jgi:hypothetical protein
MDSHQVTWLDLQDVEGHCEYMSEGFSLQGLLETLTQDIVTKLQRGPTQLKYEYTQII